MESKHTWFHSGPVRDSIISFDLPIHSKWRVIQKENELEYQAEPKVRGGVRPISFACIKVLCHDLNDVDRVAYLRIYKQIPHSGTQTIVGPATRQQQAVAWIPPELLAYRDMTEKGSKVTPRILGWKVGKQDSSDQLPEGFLVSFAWLKVPGVRLGDSLGAAKFWEYGRQERDRIRSALRRTLP